MTQYVFTLTSRMVAIASACVALLGILFFLLGVEMGKLWVAHEIRPHNTNTKNYSVGEVSQSNLTSNDESSKKP